MKLHLFTFLAYFILSNLTKATLAQGNVVQGGSISTKRSLALQIYL